MQWYLINTDWAARDDIITDDHWFDQEMAFAGDYVTKKWKHATLFQRLEVDDILFMYHSLNDNREHVKNHKGFVGVGIVKEEWDEACHEGPERFLYETDLVYEYRIAVRWELDWRSNPRSPSKMGLHIPPSYYCIIHKLPSAVRKMLVKEKFPGFTQ